MSTLDLSSLQVVHIVPALFSINGEGIVGGAERYVLELARHMATSIRTTLVSFGKQHRTERVGDLEIKIIGDAHYVKGQKANPINFRGLVPILKRNQIVHCHQQHVVCSSFAALYSRITGKRVFVTDLGGGGWDVSAYLSTDSWYHGHLHISEYSRRIFGQGTYGRAHVILGGVDTEKFSAHPEGLIPSQQRSPDRVLFVGRLLPHKGVNDLIEALPPGMHLDIIGRPYDVGFLKELHRLAEGKSVHFQHDCDDEALIAAYRQAACIVLPSVYHTPYGASTNVPELLGQTLLEGMSCGALPICTDVASMPEIVEDGISGKIVPPNNPAALRNALEWVRANSLEAQAMGERARQRVLDKFTWNEVVRRCLRIYAAA